MKLRIIGLAMLVMLAACGAKEGALKDYLRHSDSAIISFYHSEDSATQITIHDKESIGKLGECIDGKKREHGKCKEDGSIWFYENGKKKMQVDFSMNNECNYFSYMMNDKVYAKEMDAEAVEYLNSIREIATGAL